MIYVSLGKPGDGMKLNRRNALPKSSSSNRAAAQIPSL